MKFAVDAATLHVWWLNFFYESLQIFTLCDYVMRDYVMRDYVRLKLGFILLTLLLPLTCTESTDHTT